MEQDDVCEKLKDPPVDSGSWGNELLSALDWKRFRWLCAEALQAAGFETELADDEEAAGADFEARRDGDDPIAVHCLQRNVPVGVGDVRQLLSKATARGCPNILVVTSAAFTDSVRAEYDEDPGVELVDGEQVLEGIEDLGEETAQTLLTGATDGGDWHVPTCPECAVKMVPRVRGNHSKEPGMVYWGCRNYFSPSRCQRTFSADEGGIALPS